ncbi:tail fiber protein [Parvibaculaceae bacterium PLY_AMNH_Bact1]|nr:tail fiber protein [Parvibaculaceae bacterium PLY_AMNH_Bact1]
MTAFRIAIADFQLGNPLYVGASVFFYEVGSDGLKTDQLATLYANPTGTAVVQNPQVLDSTGKLSRPVYIGDPVIADVVGATFGSHETGVIAARGTWKGDFATATRYYVNDVVAYGGSGAKQDNIYLASQDFLSDATTIETDITAGHLLLVVDVETVNTLSIAAATSASAAAASATAAATAQSAAETAQGSAEAVLADANFLTVVGISSEITTVAGISANITTVAGIETEIQTVAGDSADIQTVAANIGSISAKLNIDFSNASTELPVNKGGTGSSTAAAARTALGLEDYIADLFVGTTQLFMAATAPTPWLALDGAEVSRTTYARLWTWVQAHGNLAATEGAKTAGEFGPGDGSTTFSLPDLQDKAVIGQSGTKAAGSVGGSETHTLTAGNLPSGVKTITGGGALTEQIQNPGTNNRSYFSNPTFGADGASDAINHLPPYVAGLWCVRT